jgi:hypothetical protein
MRWRRIVDPADPTCLATLLSLIVVTFYAQTPWGITCVRLPWEQTWLFLWGAQALAVVVLRTTRGWSWVGLALATYRPSDTPAWYDALDEEQRRAAQAFFWAEIAKRCNQSDAVFCYDLMNEPVSPGGKREKYASGHLLGGFDFLQAIALDPKGRPRDQIAPAWIARMRAAIRAHDKDHLVTVGLLPGIRSGSTCPASSPRPSPPRSILSPSTSTPRRTRWTTPSRC